MTKLLIKILSIVPDAVYYFLSDIFFVILFYIVGYRKAIVVSNLDAAFPEKSDAEKKMIQKKFYKNLCDWFVETFIIARLSKKKLNQLMICDYTLFAQTHKQNKNFYGLLGHQFNWELVNLFFSGCDVYESCNTIYTPINNTFFNTYYFEVRSQNNTNLINAYEFGTKIRKLKNKKHCMGLVADQRPYKPDNAFWLDFLNQKTPFIKEPEKCIFLFDAEPFFAEIIKLKRGRYECKIQPVIFDKNQSGSFTTAYAKMLEASINKYPENYLWTHKRWKYKYDETKHNLL